VNSLRETRVVPSLGATGCSRLLVPSLFAADHGALAEAAQEAITAGATRLHIDMIDGRFAPGLGLSLGALASLVRRFPATAFDVHLMVEAPTALAVEAARLGAASVTIHVEAAADPVPLFRQLRAMGTAPGVALKPGTAIDTVSTTASEVSLLLVMFIEPGHVGETARPGMLAKLAALREMHPATCLVADGGIDLTIARATAMAGANHVVCGGALFRTGVAAAYPPLAAAIGDP
jgi:ribulose-phosphate 3-epimerase